MVKDYDLILETASATTTQSALLLNGTANTPVVTPDDYIQSVYKLTVTNTGSAVEIITFQAGVYTGGTPSNLYTVATISIPAGDTQMFSELDLKIVIPSGYYLLVQTSAGTANVQALAYFTPA